MLGIERRAKRDLFLFTYGHREFYTTLEDYRSANPEFREWVRPLLPKDWTISDKPGIWCAVQPPEDRTPEAGFKIHVSSTPDKARELLSAMVPILVGEGVAFKFLVDYVILDFNSSIMRSSGACGKFVTIYPTDRESLGRLMERLHEATRGFEGPYVLSDKRYKDSKVLSYRYGAFKNYYRVNVYGEPEPFFRTDDGQLVRDARPPYFELPEGVTDPFPDEESDEEGETSLMNGRYKATKSMGSSAKGGVYRAIDVKNRVEVVIKEARPHINRGRDFPYDAVDCLKNEHRVLEVLADTGVTPKPLDFFQEWEHSFLVMELARGTNLASYRAFETFSILLMTSPGAEDIRKYCKGFLEIARSLAEAIRVIHEKHVAINDLAPQNILFDPEQRRLTLIDFESAYYEHEGVASPIIPLRTIGFGTGERGHAKPTFAEDYVGLSRVLGDLLYPVTPFFGAAPELRRPMLEHVAREKGIPAALIRLIFEAAEGPEKLDALFADAERSLEDVHAPKPLAPQRKEDDLRELVSRISGYIEDQIERSKDPLDLPTDYRRFVTNPLSVAFGASGIALFLKRARGEAPTRLVDELARRAAEIDHDRYTPGLYVGASGVAWTLLELGRQEEAKAVLDAAASSPLLFENADMFYGAAGYGLTNLFFFRRLGDEKYLRNAAHAFSGIKGMLQEAETGYYYTNMGDICHGLAHGASGIGYFLFKLYQATGKDEHLDYARKLVDFEVSSAEEREGYVVFRRGAREPVNTPYWRVGAAGVGVVAIRLHEALGDERYLAMAKKIAYYLSGKFAVFPTNFSGMVGIGNFFLDLYQRTGESEYRDEARRYLDRVMLFALDRPAGLVFPGEELIRVSTDYGTGSAGTGTFIHRLLTGAGVPYLDF